MDPMITVTYENGTRIDEADVALTILQISLKHGLPHLHECGGHARCSTCRVMIREGLDNVLPRNPPEQRLADARGFEPDIRLACQTHLRGSISLRRLVNDDKDVAVIQSEDGRSTGCERAIAILFSDIRDFTPFAEANMPYDVVHILNRYFLVMGDAVLENGGTIDKYIGDGMMALFGVDGGKPRDLCLAAVRTGLRMLDDLANLDRYLKEHFNVEFHIRIGMHFGDVVVGRMGHPRNMQYTAIGDAVNMASRIESAVKGTGASLLVSESVYSHVKDDVQTGIVTKAELKGKHGTHRLYEVVGLVHR
jgi:adenylate cyclase